ncbi:hypothetical protein [Paraburkholderia sp.]|uniref:hypothetical protein n=1 Tax=Paraburkholderia sp. TaxID=1926495 RepID=UPI00239854CF|nr:hypothetical protein [Paraburkholderia sp.]MDE1182285.1 hypothetical protein [Paraburkholderia sp.]
MTTRPFAAATAAAVTAAAMAAIGVPSAGVAQSEGTGAPSRAELYRRHLLAGTDVPCRTNASCAALGAEALEAGRLDDAKALIAMEAQLADAASLEAADQNAWKAIVVAQARAAMAFVHQGDLEVRLGAWTNARAYYRSAIGRGNDYPDDPSLARAVQLARARYQAIAHKSVIAGLPASGARFERYLSPGARDVVTLTPVKGRRGVYRIDGSFLDPVVSNDGWPRANTGSVIAYLRFYDGVARVPLAEGHNGTDAAPLDATARIADIGAARRQRERCVIEFDLSAPETLDVVTHGPLVLCGFGLNVIADGRYYLKSGT